MVHYFGSSQVFQDVHGVVAVVREGEDRPVVEYSLPLLFELALGRDVFRDGLILHRATLGHIALIIRKGDYCRNLEREPGFLHHGQQGHYFL